MAKHLLLSVYLFCTLSLLAEKKPLNHSVYDGWKNISNNTISENGRYVMYQINPQEGDGILEIVDRNTGKKITIPRGYQGLLSSTGQHAVCLIKAPFSEIRRAKIKKVKPEDIPSDSLAIIDLPQGITKKIAFVKGYKTGKKGSAYLAWLSTDTALISKTGKKDKAAGLPLFIRNLATETQDTLLLIKEYQFSYDGKHLAATQQPAAKDTLAKPSVIYYNPEKNQQKCIATGQPFYAFPSFSKTGTQLTFLASPDTIKEGSKRCNLCYYQVGRDSAEILIPGYDTPGIPSEWSISENQQPYFSTDGKRLFAGIAPVRAPKDTSIIDSETAQLDIWHYTDSEIQPMQLKNRDKELKRTYLSVVNLSNPHHLIPLGTTDMRDITLMNEGNAPFAFGTDNTNYRLEKQWSIENKQDLYLIDLNNGTRKEIKKGITGNPTPSPEGNYIVWYEETNKQWYSYSVNNHQLICLTHEMTIPFWNEAHDTPNNPSAYGLAGWTTGDASVWIYDQFDIWQFAPDGSTDPICITRGEGRKRNIAFQYRNIDPEQRSINPKEQQVLNVFDKTTKEKGYFTLEAGFKKAPVERILEGYTFSNLEKAAKAPVYIFEKSNFNTSPNLYITSNLWKTEEVLTNINPQMENYNWGTAELLKWTTADDISAEGILYKPENFDPNKKYPLLIYFYEKHSDNLYNYFAPAPSRSTINIPFFCSRGYLVFTPDIYYTTGLPGESACNSILPAVEKLCQNSWVDRNNMAIQGQSWGGYQVAYLVTRTNMFKAAAAGAPVSNMTSAYGGIRWSTGMSRQYQYEQTQSRIGKTLWEAPELYILNSPVFRADKVNTPLLIMHNDNDGAVPWYQGIEYFMALRRLGKPVWLLQYNNEEHNLTQRRNAKDLSIRLQQFFDHYLKGDPMPTWMKNGVPATKKGEDLGIE